MNINCPGNLDILYRAFKSAYKFDINQCIIREINCSYFGDVKRLLSNDSFFDWKFVIDYYNSCNKCYRISYKNITFNILVNGTISKKKREHLCKSIYRVYLTAKLYNIIKDFNYYIIMYPGKRTLPKKHTSINAVNINGGFTYINRNDIYIVRYQDYEKVILHELLHHNMTMHYDGWKPHNLQILKKLSNISERQLLIPNEAIIETFACILNTIFYSLETGKNFKELLKRDKEHSLKIAKNVLDHQGDYKWFEKTNCYCYVVYKTILYVYINDFLKIYKCRNDDDITQFIIRYFPKLKTRLKRIKGNGKSLKQTIF